MMILCVYASHSVLSTRKLTDSRASFTCIKSQIGKSQMHCEPMFLQDPHGYCTVYCVCLASEFFSFFCQVKCFLPFLMLENSDLLFLSQTTFKSTHPLRPTCFQVSYTSRHCTIQRRVGRMASSTYFRTLQGWAHSYSWWLLETVWFFSFAKLGQGNPIYTSVEFFFSLIGKGTPQDKKALRFSSCSDFGCHFFGDVFLDFNPFGCYMNHEKKPNITHFWVVLFTWPPVAGSRAPQVPKNGEHSKTRIMGKPSKKEDTDSAKFGQPLNFWGFHM